MGKIMIGMLVGLVLGGAGALFLGGGALLGLGAGTGIATGLSAGICSTVTAAQELGLMTAAQVDEVLNKAVLDVTGQASLPDDQTIVDSTAQCEEFMAKLGEAR